MGNVSLLAWAGHLSKPNAIPYFNMNPILHHSVLLLNTFSVVLRPRPKNYRFKYHPPPVMWRHLQTFPLIFKIFDWWLKMFQVFRRWQWSRAFAINWRSAEIKTTIQTAKRKNFLKCQNKFLFYRGPRPCGWVGLWETANLSSRESKIPGLNPYGTCNYDEEIVTKEQLYTALTYSICAIVPWRKWNKLNWFNLCVFFPFMRLDISLATYIPLI